MTEFAASSSVDPAEVERFSRIAEAWWDPNGKFAPLHRFNPVRLDILRREAARALGRDPARRRPFEGLRALDVGCGGGLISEPLSRLGFAVDGIDASDRNLEVARAHAAAAGLEIAYRAATVEALLAEGAGGYDLVLALEVVEHVAEPRSFLQDCVRLARPGGVIVAATLNRTLRSLLTAKIGAEYVLGWLPRGAHDWRKFLKPAELRALLEAAGVEVRGPFGVGYAPLSDRWFETADASVNYMLVARKPA